MSKPAGIAKRSVSQMLFLKGFFLGSLCMSLTCLFFYSVSQSQYLSSEAQEEQSLAVPKKILLTKWTKSLDLFFYEDANKVCSNRCLFTNNMSEFHESSAVVFHGNNHDLLRNSSLVSRTSPNQIWIWINLEAPLSYEYDAEMHSRLQFNWTMSYRLDSDIFAPYRRFYPRDKVPNRMEIIQNYSIHKLGGREVPTELPSLEGFNNRKPAAWIVSNCLTWSQRELLVEALVTLFDFPVDIYGHCGRLNCNESASPASDSVKNSEECRFQIQHKYKFYFAFENALCTDYVTEKFFETLFFDMIPVVYGSAEYTKQFPAKSFINVLDFPNLASLMKHLNYVGNNSHVWLEYFEWRKSYRIVDSHYLPAYCDICDRLILGTQSPSVQIQPKVYKELYNWWTFKRNSAAVNSSSSRNCKSTEEATEMLIKYIQPS